MKKIQSLSILFILFIGTLSFNSCNENEEKIEEQNYNKIFYRNIDYGKIHNQGLETYYKKYKKNETDFFIILERMNEINNKEGLFKKNQKLTRSNLTNFASFFLGTSNIKNKNSDNQIDYVNRSNEMINYFNEKGFYSNQLKLLLSELLNNNSSPEEIRKKMGEYYSKANEQEKDIIYALLSIYNASDKFWSKLENNSRKKGMKLYLGCNPGHQVRFADALGGIFGGMLASASSFGVAGYVGAAVGSQAMSAAIENAQSAQGGGCL